MNTYVFLASDTIFMQRCLHLAQMGIGRVAPNPLVGCVIVHEGRIIGEGYHQQFGGPHAEVNAIFSVKNPKLLSEASLYVNLEPCAHHGKTPPCADLLVKHRLKRVVIANRDPFEEVDGKGIARLRQAGIEVETGLLEAEGKFLNRRFFTFHSQRRPYIVLKWAQSIDGKMDRIRKVGDGQAPAKITGSESNRLVHRWRSEESGILVGSTTALLDDPRLTVRGWKGSNPTRVVLDRRGRLSESLKVFDDAAPTLCFSNRNKQANSNEWIALAPGSDGIEQVLEVLYERGVQSVLVEGGSEIHHELLAKELWDEARIFVAPEGLSTGIPAPRIPSGKALTVHSGNDRLLTYHRQ